MLGSVSLGPQSRDAHALVSETDRSLLAKSGMNGRQVEQGAGRQAGVFSRETKENLSRRKR